MAQILVDFFSEYAIANAMDKGDLIHPGSDRVIEVFFEGFHLKAKHFTVAHHREIFGKLLNVKVNFSGRLLKL
jgi:hypothetical protein